MESGDLCASRAGSLARACKTALFGLGVVLASFSDTALAQYQLTNLVSNQVKHAEADDKPEQQYRDFGLRLSSSLTFSCSHCPLRMTADTLNEPPFKHFDIDQRRR